MPPQNISQNPAPTPSPVSNETPRNRTGLIVGGIILGLIILAFIAYLIYQSYSNASSVLGTPSTTATSTQSGITASTTEGSGTITSINPGQQPVLPPEPTLLNTWTPPASDPALTPDAVTAIDVQLASTTAALKTNSTNINDWITLGIYRKDLDDYQGALADFQYALALAPGYSVPLSDIADLYANFLPASTANFNVAVSDYKKAIASTPSDGSLYEGLADVYRYRLSDIPDARITLQAGITAKAQGYQDLQTELNSLPQS